MVTVVKTKANVVSDDTGIEQELPILVTEHGVLDLLLDYLLAHQHDRSESWMERVVYATYLLIQYMEANHECFENPQQLFQSFAQRLYTGTIGDNGLDPSGLYWLPSSTRTTNGLIISLTGLTDWLADKQGTKPMNPLRTADSYEQRLNYAAWFRRNQHDFLGHIEDTIINQTVRKARHIRGRRAVVTVHDDVIGFPESLFCKFFLEGMGGVGDRRTAIRNQLILLMMHFAGCRISDTLHLWIEDVLVDPKYGSIKKRGVFPANLFCADDTRGRVLHCEQVIQHAGHVCVTAEKSQAIQDDSIFRRDKYLMIGKNKELNEGN